MIAEPKEKPPVKNFECIKCGRLYYGAKAIWNEYAGRWLFSYNCPHCDTHQEVFVSSPARQMELRREKDKRKGISDMVKEEDID
jgi:hypothetical protein